MCLSEEEQAASFNCCPFNLLKSALGLRLAPTHSVVSARAARVSRSLLSHPPPQPHRGREWQLPGQDWCPPPSWPRGHLPGVGTWRLPVR